MHLLVRTTGEYHGDRKQVGESAIILPISIMSCTVRGLTANMDMRCQLEKNRVSPISTRRSCYPSSPHWDSGYY